MAFNMVFTQLGARRLAQAAMGLGGGDIYNSLHLFVNDYYPGWAEDGSELVECINGGYAALNPAWGGAVEADLADRLQYTAANLTWTFAAYAGPLVTVYGAYAKSATGVVCMVGRNTTPFVIPLAGGTLVAHPLYQSIAATT